MTLQTIIDTLHLKPLSVEGGMVAQTYLSDFKVGNESAGTCIYYLLSGDAFSHLHQLTGDEMYHFYLGDPVTMLELLPDGTTQTTILGADLAVGQTVQHLVPAGHWQGSRLCEGGKFALLGTTMWPAYADEGYTHADAAALQTQYPTAKEEIARLTGEAKYQ